MRKVIMYRRMVMVVPRMAISKGSLETDQRFFAETNAINTPNPAPDFKRALAIG